MSRCLLAFLNDMPQAAKQKLDLTFRLSFLEGVARRTPGDWTRTPTKGAVEARQFFEDQGIPVDQDWFAVLPTSPWLIELDHRTYGMTRAYQDSLAAIGVSQEDITNELISDIANPAAKRQRNVFYSFGLSWDDPAKLTNTNPKDAKKTIGGGLTRALAHHIKDVLKRKSNRPQVMQVGPGPSSRNPSNRDSWDVRLEEQPSDAQDGVSVLIDLLGTEHGVAKAVLGLADAAIDHVTTDKVGRFVLRRFFEYMQLPQYNIRAPGAVKDKRPNRSKMWAMLARIREQVRVDMLNEFDPEGKWTEEERARFARRLYGILGSAERGSGGDSALPPKIEAVLKEIQKYPAVAQLLERFQKERERLELHNMTASVVMAFQLRKARKELGLLGVLLGA